MAGFVSQAQREKWQQLLADGKITRAQYDQRASESPRNLPERASPRTRSVGASRSTDAAQVGKTRY